MGLTLVKGNMIQDGTVTSTDFANDPRNASNLNSGDVPAAQLDNAPITSTAQVQDDIALLGFKIASNGSLSKYNLVDQTVDAFEDATGIDASASTDETRNAAKYYSGAIAGSATYTVFTTTPGGGTWTVPSGVTSVEALVVAGGGAGGNGYAGGGGGGGIVHHTSFAVTPGADVTVTVGAGGAGINSASAANKGGDSVFSTMTATGGGGGGTSAAAGTSGGSGGGGGSAGPYTAGMPANQPAVSGATVYANAGGDGEGAPDYTSGGGGGAGAAGSNSNGNAAGPGGAGKLFSNFTSYGVSGWFGGGGGGSYNSAYATSAGTGGQGGGGNGREVAAGNAYDATTNTGSGGGGGGKYWAPVTYSGAGGSGFIGLLYTPNIVNNMTLVSNSTTAEAAPIKGSLVMTYTNGAGTAVINTDITAEFSADNGSTYTPMTLASQGTTGGHTILSANDVTRTSTSGTSMRYRIKTLNQSASKDTRIHAVSLGWA